MFGGKVKHRGNKLLACGVQPVCEINKGMVSSLYERSKGMVKACGVGGGVICGFGPCVEEVKVWI